MIEAARPFSFPGHLRTPAVASSLHANHVLCVRKMQVFFSVSKRFEHSNITYPVPVVTVKDRSGDTSSASFSLAKFSGTRSAVSAGGGLLLAGSTCCDGTAGLLLGFPLFMFPPCGGSVPSTWFPCVLLPCVLLCRAAASANIMVESQHIRINKRNKHLSFHVVLPFFLHR